MIASRSVLLVVNTVAKRKLKYATDPFLGRVHL
jgi:hypothetical protein